MALTLERWIALVVAGCLVAMALILNEVEPRPREPNPRRALAMRQERLNNASATAAYRLRLLQLRDSLRSAAGKAPGGLRVLIAPSFTALDRTRLNALFHRVSMGRNANASGPVDLAVLHDTVRMVRGRPIFHGAFNFRHILPAGGYDRCWSIATMGGIASGGRIIRSGWFASQDNGSRFMGPCAFYDRFGAPGAGIDRWLRDGSWTYGTSGVSRANIASGDLRYGYVEPPSMWYVNGREAELRGSSVPLGFRCLSGDPAACTAVVLGPKPDYRGQRARVLPDGIFENRTYYWQNQTLGPSGSYYLADMAKLLGDDTFRKFWTSPQPPTDAFAAATGQDLGEWTVLWARRVYGEIGRGPALPPSSTIWSLIVIGVGLGVAIAASRRRQVA